MTHSPIASRVGMRMFQAVILYWLATIVFGLSHFMWLSVAALFVMGAADTRGLQVIGVGLEEYRRIIVASDSPPPGA